MRSEPFDLARFVEAQEGDYDRALAEVRAGRKRTHWIWYVFPQVEGLGSSPMAVRYAIGSIDEARAYLDHPVLGPRLVEVAEAAAAIVGKTATEVFGSPDDLKVRSSATLFAAVAPGGSAFARLLDRFYGGSPDPETVRRLGLAGDRADPLP